MPEESRTAEMPKRDKKCFFQVSKLGHYSEEIRRSLSEILLSVMNILLQKYKNIQSNNKRNVADQESFYHSFFGDGRSYCRF